MIPINSVIQSEQSEQLTLYIPKPSMKSQYSEFSVSWSTVLFFIAENVVVHHPRSAA